MATQIDPCNVEPAAVLAAADFRDARVLEVGSGNGRLTFPLAEMARSVVGIDLKHGELASALSSRPEYLAPSLHLVAASAVSLPFRDAVFDIALLASSL